MSVAPLHVGLMVHYVSYGTPGGEYTSQCRAAVVTEVGRPSEGSTYGTGLCVLNPEGMLLNRGVPHDADRAGGTFHFLEEHTS